MLPFTAVKSEIIVRVCRSFVAGRCVCTLAGSTAHRSVRGGNARLLRGARQFGVRIYFVNIGFAFAVGILLRNFAGDEVASFLTFAFLAAGKRNKHEQRQHRRKDSFCFH